MFGSLLDMSLHDMYCSKMKEKLRSSVLHKLVIRLNLFHMRIWDPAEYLRQSFFKNSELFSQKTSIKDVR